MPWGTNLVAAAVSGSIGQAPPSETHRHPRHRLDAAGEHEVLEAGAHLLRRQVHRLQAAGAEPVDLDAGHGLRQPGGQGRRPGDDRALLADRRDDAQDDVVDLRRVQAGLRLRTSSMRPVVRLIGLTECSAPVFLPLPRGVRTAS